MWANNRWLEQVGTELPVIQAPMAGANGSAMAAAVCAAGGLGSLPCALLTPEQAAAEIDAVRRLSSGPLNLNFFCHAQAPGSVEAHSAWLKQLQPYYTEFGLKTPAAAASGGRQPFAAEMCDMIESYRPEVVSFHFGLPDALLLDRVRAADCLVISSATTVEEALWLEQRGCDAIIAQGYEAGGHRAMFLPGELSTQIGTLALVPQVVDAVNIPVIAAGGIGDGRGMAAAMVLGAAAVQVGTAYLFTPEALISNAHRAALHHTQDHPHDHPQDNVTALTNLFSGKPARSLVNRIMREIGPMSEHTPAFPTAGMALAPLKAAAGERGQTDFSSLWSGQAASLATRCGAGELTRKLASDTQTLLTEMASRIQPTGL
jgi:nitronate monooxygenase